MTLARWRSTAIDGAATCLARSVLDLGPVEADGVTEDAEEAAVRRDGIDGRWESVTGGAAGCALAIGHRWAGSSPLGVGVDASSDVGGAEPRSMAGSLELYHAQSTAPGGGSGALSVQAGDTGAGSGLWYSATVPGLGDSQASVASANTPGSGPRSGEAPIAQQEAMDLDGGSGSGGPQEPAEPAEPAGTSRPRANEQEQQQSTEAATKETPMETQHL